MMSKKAARLYGRMQHGIEEKQAVVNGLLKNERPLEKGGRTDPAKKFIYLLLIILNPMMRLLRRMREIDQLMLSLEWSDKERSALVDRRRMN